jgi:predicted house-cleaning noncanonical NTP pyrophosphatase (MazG superfamily)
VAEGKLVRDLIPEIVEAAGRTARTRALAPSERLGALLTKLREESDELSYAVSVVEQTEELADVLEVLLAIAAEIDVPWPKVEVVAEAKRLERGGFDKGIFLESG